MKKVELLSPVGNMKMLYQAIHNGCDAVYLSGKKYGARAFANNFSNDELITAIKYSHLYDVKVYVTINTLINQNEIKDLLEYVEFLYRNNVDAVLIQDIGMLSTIHEKFPNLELHSSTQMNNVSNEQLNILKSIGVKRAVLARELSLKEINSFDKDIEKEVFVHGALCVSYSGECLFSSLNGGRSANRGSCVGSCRLPYELYINGKMIKTDGKYLLSMKELNTLENLKELLDAGIDSLKIEGRMKSPYYVGYVTKLYRMLIDKYYNNEEMILSEDEKKNLLLLFNRQFTEGFLFNDKDVSNIKTPNHQGIKIGQVIKIDNNYIYIKLDETLNQEDSIRFKESETGMTVNMLYDKNEYLVNKISKGNIALVKNKITSKKGEDVLKTIDIVLEKLLKDYIPKKIKVSFIVKLIKNKQLIIQISDQENTIIEKGEVVEKALKVPITKNNIINALKKLGNTPFIADKIDIEMDNDVFLNLKTLNEIRRKLIEKLINMRENRKHQPLIINDNIEKKFISSNMKKTLNVLVRTEEQLNVCIKENIDNIYVEDEKLYEKYKNRNNIYFRIDREESNFKDYNNKKLLIGSLGAIKKYKNNNLLIGDYYLNVTNNETIKFLNKNNVNKVTLSIELNDYDIKDIMDNNYNVEVIIYGRPELMIMKYCPLKKCLKYCSKCKMNNDKFSLKNKEGKIYPFFHNNCLTHIMNDIVIDNVDKIKAYENMNIKSFRIELYDENKEETIKIIKKVFTNM